MRRHHRTSDLLTYLVPCASVPWLSCHTVCLRVLANAQQDVIWTLLSLTVLGSVGRVSPSGFFSPLPTVQDKYVNVYVCVFLYKFVCVCVGGGVSNESRCGP